MKKLLLFPILVLAAGNATAQCVTPADPTVVTASPSEICSDTGGYTDLNATAASNYIFWYTSSTGGTPFAVTPTNSNLNVNVPTTTVYYAEAVNLSSPVSATYSYTGGVQYFVVPFGVDTVQIEAWGAQGNSNAQSVAGGLGGYATGLLPVNAGDTLWIYVGGGGNVSSSGGYNGGGNAGMVGDPSAFGGGGGGASDVRLNYTTLNDRVIVAGGGGGAGGNRMNSLGRGTGGGGGAGYYGGGGGAAWPYTSTILPTGGTQTAGGIGGNSDWTSVPNNDGYPGQFGIGGTGGDETTSNQSGSQTASAGGYGGGTTGGDGSYPGNFAGQSGAGGSGYTGTLTMASMTDGIRSGNGQIVLTYLGACPSSGRTPVTVTVHPLPAVTATAAPASSVCENTSVTLSGSGANSFTWSGPVAVTDNTPFTVTSADGGNYIVTGTDAFGCMNNDTISVTVLAAPALVTTTNASAICFGDSSIIAVAGADTYAWSNGNMTAQQTVMPSATTTYIVTGTDTTTGCSSMDSLMITVNPLPVLTTTGNAAICEGGADTLMSAGADTYSWSSGGTTDTEIVSPVTTTSYTVTGTITATGCISVDSVTVTVNTNPEVLATANSTTVCEGTSVTMMATGADTYAWSSGGNGDTETVTPVSSMSYTVTGTDTLTGCMGSDTIMITVNPLPAVTLTLADNSVCVTDGALTLAGGSPAGGTWSGTAVTGSTFTPATAGTGTFAIVYTYVDSNSCTSSATQNMTVDACVGIIENGANGGVSFYPNPASEQLTINWSANENVQRIDVMDVTGRVVMSQAVKGGNSAELRVASLAAGVYNLILVNESGNSTYRFIKN